MTEKDAVGLSQASEAYGRHTKRRPSALREARGRGMPPELGAIA
jgi:hypothetical protein